MRASGQTATQTAYSRPDGRFILAGLPHGTYLIEYRGCSPIGRYTGQWYGGLSQKTAARVAVTSALPVRLAPVTLGMISPQFDGAATPRPSLAARLRTLSLQLSAGRPLPADPDTSQSAARISGRVTNRAGRGLKGICILALQADGNLFTGTTSKTGGYSIRVRQGHYRVNFLSECAATGNYAPQMWKGAGSLAKSSVLRVRPHQLVRSIDAVLGAGAAISGRVRTGPRVHASLGGICIDALGTGGQQFFYGARGHRDRVRGIEGRITVVVLPRDARLVAAATSEADVVAAGESLRQRIGAVAGGPLPAPRRPADYSKIT